MADGIFHRNDYSEREPWSAQQIKSNTKSKTPLKGKPGSLRGPHAIRVPKNRLDITRLPHRRATLIRAWRRSDYRRLELFGAPDIGEVAMLRLYVRGFRKP